MNHYINPPIFALSIAFLASACEGPTDTGSTDDTDVVDDTGSADDTDQDTGAADDTDQDTGSTDDTDDTDTDSEHDSDHDSDTDFVCTEDTNEPNNGMDDATSVPVTPTNDVAITGSLVVETFGVFVSDWYAFDVPGGCTATALSDLPASPLVYFNMYDASGDRIDNSSGASAELEAIHSAGSDTTFYVRLDSEDGPACIPYELLFAVTCP